MSISILNLRTFGIGTKPDSLEPGQICFNLTERRIFVGDGSDYLTSFDGTTTPGLPGSGWFEMPMGDAGLSEYFLQNPASLGDNPIDGQVLSWNSLLNQPVWTTITPGGPTSGAVYQTTNSAVAAAPGATITEKLNAALGVSPTTVCAAIVTGNPGDTYQGLYYFTNGFWVFAANYAYPTAAQVPYSGLNSGLVANNVQDAIDEVNNKASEAVIDAASAENTANNANATAAIAESTANNALAIAQQAIPRSVLTTKGQIIVATGASTYAAFPSGFNGQVLIADSTQPTGLRWTSTIPGIVSAVYGVSPIIVNNSDPSNPVISVNAASTGAPGVVQLDNTTSSTSTTQAPTANALKITYDLANAALPQTGGVLTGDLTLNNQSDLRFADADSSNWVAFQAPASVPSDITWTLPATDGLSGEVLTTNGAGLLSWSSSSSFITISGINPIVVDNTDPANPIISVDNASQTTAGVVQLNDTTTSTSTTQAATANAVKTTFDVADAALPKAGGTLTGTLFSIPLQTPGITSASDLGLAVEPLTGQVKSLTAFDAGEY
jgi:hypothetical protein